ncbi:mechanosensitive ion channel protein MscS [Jannaschia pagri]|uniref:Mechanosensitive ion channel protein MscS n=1 Tax=Jannaschia pagri TaxID=2829797 RepID=A0ABQ4NMY5_9RHOB|nr:MULTISPECIES: mechanosensitive ion channel domain-containing protein [unclassified Jannaschia]GIT91914.1 mechanosensitive ion channel protein MscS [Jannaschia sp. AI_61]GIT95748.1 mechanosensitive ion channel protein MscS [Jannaschia sp. AI_62]
MLRLLLSLALVCALATPLRAQSEAVPPEWTVVSERAVSLLQSETVSDAALDRLRAQLVDWRAQFDEARTANSGRIATVRAEIDALGPAPAEGESEPEDVASRRAELREQLETLLAPVRAAEVAYNSVNGLIAETDTVIEGRRAAALLSQETPPVNPVTWWPAVTAASTWFLSLAGQIAAPFTSGEAGQVLREDGLRIGLLSTLALLLVFRSYGWLSRLRAKVLPEGPATPLGRLSELGLTFLRMVMPVLGLVVALRVVEELGVGGAAADAMMRALPVMVAWLLVSRWLAAQAFPAQDNAVTLFPVAPANRLEGRFHAILLGIMAALAVLVYEMSDSSRDVAQSRAVFHFAISVVAGLTLIRLGQFLLREAKADAEDGDASFWSQVNRLVGRALMIVGLITPLAIGAGYVNLGLAMLWPTVMSIALLVGIGVAQAVVFDAFAAITGRTETARDALAPTLVGFALAVASLPLFALVWGVRLQTLGEWWQAFLNGIAIGETRLSPENFLTFVLVFVAGYMATRLVKGVLRTSVLPKTNLDTGGTNAILSGTGYVGITLAALLAITTAGIDLSGLAIVAGALSVGVGFGLQTIVQNFVSGIILLIERPIKLGDWINVNGMDGFVRQISVRSTRIETFDRQDVIIPNADLIAGTVTNYTLGNSSGRVLVPVGVAYGTDTRKVEAILREIVEAHPMVVLNPPPTITMEGFGADSLDFMIRAVLRDVLWKVTVKSDINHEIAKRFQEEGIEIPFAQRDVWLRNPETLQTRAPRTAAASDQSAPPADDVSDDGPWQDEVASDPETADPEQETT